MMNRAMLNGTRAFSPIATGPIVQKRNMANLKEIAMRLKSIQSIQKITKSMKMVSAAKFSRAEREMKAGRAFASSVTALSQQNNLVVTNDDNKGKLIVAMSSDRGLCGGIHSSISKYLRPVLDGDSESKIVIVGDKVRGQLARKYADRFQFVVTEYGKKPPTFVEASSISTKILATPFTVGNVVYNRFVSAISYEATDAPIFSSASLASNEKLIGYQSGDEDGTYDAYQEFHLATSIYGAMIESAASEQSARMNAMENATKNAGEMIDKLALLYNRTRQAVITNELIEIISGAAAV
eukprot:Awhi_evm1s1991